jgi:hypothetical protein
MKTKLIFFILVLTGSQLCFPQEISKADIKKTLVHIQSLAKQQGEQLAKAQVNLDALQQVNTSLTQRNEVLASKAHKALRKFLCLYLIIGLLVAWILRKPIIGLVNAYVFHA